jgi:hypothetical protein
VTGRSIAVPKPVQNEKLREIGRCYKFCLWFCSYSYCFHSLAVTQATSPHFGYGGGGIGLIILIVLIVLLLR